MNLLPEIMRYYLVYVTRDMKIEGIYIPMGAQRHLLEMEEALAEQGLLPFICRIARCSYFILGHRGSETFPLRFVNDPNGLLGEKVVYADPQKGIQGGRLFFSSMVRAMEILRDQALTTIIDEHGKACQLIDLGEVWLKMQDHPGRGLLGQLPFPHGGAQGRSPVRQTGLGGDDELAGRGARR